MNETPQPVPEIKNCGLAVWSLVLGIMAIVLSAVCIGPLFAIPAVICGHIAYSRVRRSQGQLTGDGLALGGLITGYLSIALIPVIILLAAIAIPNFVKARVTTQKNACVNNLRIIDGAKQQWALENHKDASATPMPADLDKYIQHGFASLQCPQGGIYTINAVGLAPTCDIPGHILPGGLGPVAPPPERTNGL